jgi:hypothetical protein
MSTTRLTWLFLECWRIYWMIGTIGHSVVSMTLWRSDKPMNRTG